MQARCPSCGSFLNFKSERSAYVVCASCQTLVARKGVDTEAVGKVADLQPDGSMLQVGTQGVFEGQSFEIIGRIQVALGPPQKPDVIWNEWCASFSQGRTGWIGEAQGEYFVSFEEKATGLPKQNEVHLGQVLNLGKEAAVVTSLAYGTALGFEGELPFIMSTSYQALFVNLSSHSGAAATLDYSEDPPIFFKGRWCSYEELKFSGLRYPDEEGRGPQISASQLQSLKCASCGAPHELKAGGISQTLVCGFCDTVMDLNQDATFKEVLRFEQAYAKVPGLIPLGSTGRLPGEARELTCIGYMRRSCKVDGITYRWSEYLLYELASGYRWLTESNGHWTLLGGLHRVPVNAGRSPITHPPNTSIFLDGQEYRHFQRTSATVDYVAGEFPWRVRVGETSKVNDYVAPPLLLSADSSKQEFNWSKGRYLSGNEVWKAFKLPGSPPSPKGVANNQPNPFKAAAQRRWKVYGAAMVAGFSFMMLRTATAPKPFFDQQFSYKDYEASRVHMTPIEIPPGTHNLSITVSSPDLRDRWAYFPLSLIQEKNQDAYETDVSLWHERGQDSDGAWSEGKWTDTRRLSSVPGGSYQLRIEPQSNINGKGNPEGSGQEVSMPRPIFGYSVKIRQGQPMWGYIWFLAFVGIFPPLWSLWRSSNFETLRWSESDHAPVSGFDLDDD